MPPVFDGVGDPGVEFITSSRIATSIPNSAAAAVAALFGQRLRRDALPQKLCKEDAKVMPVKSFAEVAR
jgi:hypothetical protein